MTDLHTHILPGMDDGAADVSESLRMLQQEAEQGTDCVALTPHFFAQAESISKFLQRRNDAMRMLTDAAAALPLPQRRALPKLRLGAEVRWIPGLLQDPLLPELCYEGSRYLLVEMPDFLWQRQTLESLYEMSGRFGLTPVIAHIDRYLPHQKKQTLDELLGMGVPVQISAESLLHVLWRRQPLSLIKSGAAQVLISDCHDSRRRPPNLAAAAEIIRRRLGADTWERMCAVTESI